MQPPSTNDNDVEHDDLINLCLRWILLKELKDSDSNYVSVVPADKTIEAIRIIERMEWSRIRGFDLSSFVLDVIGKLEEAPFEALKLYFDQGTSTFSTFPPKSVSNGNVGKSPGVDSLPLPALPPRNNSSVKRDLPSLPQLTSPSIITDAPGKFEVAKRESLTSYEIPVEDELETITAYELLLETLLASKKNLISFDSSPSNSQTDLIAILDDTFRVHFDVVSSKKHKFLLSNMEKLEEKQFSTDLIMNRLVLLENCVSFEEYSTSNELKTWAWRQLSFVYNVILQELIHLILSREAEQQSKLTEDLTNLRGQIKTHPVDWNFTRDSYMQVIKSLYNLYSQVKEARQSNRIPGDKIHPLNSTVIICHHRISIALDASLVYIREVNPAISEASTPSTTNSSTRQQPQQQNPTKNSSWISKALGSRKKNVGKSEENVSPMMPKSPPNPTPIIQNDPIEGLASGMHSAVAKFTGLLESSLSISDFLSASYKLYKGLTLDQQTGASIMLQKCQRMNNNVSSFERTCSFPSNPAALIPTFEKYFLSPFRKDLPNYHENLKRNLPFFADGLKTFILVQAWNYPNNFEPNFPIELGTEISRDLISQQRPFVIDRNSQIFETLPSERITDEWRTACESIHEQVCLYWDTIFPSLSKSVLGIPCLWEMFLKPLISAFNERLEKVCQGKTLKLDLTLSAVLVQYITLLKHVETVCYNELPRECHLNSINLSRVLEPLVLGWVQEQEKQLPSTLKRIIESDRNFAPIEQGKVFHSTSVLDIFSLLTPLFDFFISFPLFDLVDKYILQFVNLLLSLVEKYLDFTMNNIGKFISEAELSPFDKLPISHETFEKSILKKRKHLLTPLNELCIKVARLQPRQKLFVVLTNLSFCRERISQLESSFILRMNGQLSQERIESVHRCFSKTQEFAEQQFRAFRSYVPLKIIYIDMRESLIHALHNPSLSENPLHKILPATLDAILGEIVTSVPSKLVNGLVHEMFLVFIRVYEKIICEGGKERIYTQHDADPILDEIAFIEEIFSAKEETTFGLELSELRERTKYFKVLVSTTFPMSTEQLIKEYETTCETVDLSVPLDTTYKNPFSQFNLMRVLCHRKDKASKAFFQKLKLKHAFSSFSLK